MLTGFGGKPAGKRPLRRRRCRWDIMLNNSQRNYIAERGQVYSDSVQGHFVVNTIINLPSIQRVEFLD
jgi:hypothetical protein